MAEPEHSLKVRLSVFGKLPALCKKMGWSFFRDKRIFVESTENIWVGTKIEIRDHKSCFSADLYCPNLGLILWEPTIDDLLLNQVVGFLVYLNEPSCGIQETLVSLLDSDGTCWDFFMLRGQQRFVGQETDWLAWTKNVFPECE